MGIFKAYRDTFGGIMGTGMLAGGSIGLVGGGVMGGTLGASSPEGAPSILNSVMSGAPDGVQGIVNGASAGLVVGTAALPAIAGIGAGAMFLAKKGFTPMNNRPSIEKPGIGLAREDSGKYSRFTNKMASHPIHRYGNAAGRLTGSFFKYTPEELKFDKKENKMVKKSGKFKMSGKGVAGLGLIFAGMGASNIAQDVYNGRNGMAAGTKRATPNYLDNAGATGDLVFAMHQNRRG